MRLIITASMLLWISLTTSAQAQGLNIVSEVSYPTAGKPFQALVSNSGNVFVSVTANYDTGSPAGVQVFVPASGGGLQSPSNCLNALPLNITLGVKNLSFFPDATNLAAGIGSGAIFYHVTDLLGCNGSGYIVDQGSIPASDAGTLAVVVTPDGNFAFVSNEYGLAPNATLAQGVTLEQKIPGTNPPIFVSMGVGDLTGNIGVVAIQHDISGNFTTGTRLVGQISTGGKAIAGMLLSPDGTRLYVTSEISRIAATSTTQPAGGNSAVLTKSNCVGAVDSPPDNNGLLTVIDVARAVASPQDPRSILSTVNAGCSPVRMSESKDGRTLWVAARGDNRVLAFDTAKLESDPNNALLGYADTGGTAPVGIKLFHNDKWLAVANSNRFANPPQGNATILDVATILASPGDDSVMHRINTGYFPREITVGADDATLYITNFASNQFQVIKVLAADGDLNGDGVVDVGDVFLAERIAMGLLVPTTEQLIRGDVSPLGNPDGMIDIADVSRIQMKALGLASF